MNTLIAVAADFLSSEQLDAAEGACELAIQADASSFDAWALLGATRAKQKRYELAAEAFLRALALRPEDVQAWADLGEVYMLLCDYPHAAEALKQAMLLDPKAEHPSGIRARAVVGRTMALLRKP